MRSAERPYTIPSARRCPHFGRADAEPAATVNLGDQGHGAQRGCHADPSRGAELLSRGRPCPLISSCIDYIRRVRSAYHLGRVLFQLRPIGDTNGTTTTLTATPPQILGRERGGGANLSIDITPLGHHSLTNPYSPGDVTMRKVPPVRRSCRQHPGAFFLRRQRGAGRGIAGPTMTSRSSHPMLSMA
jgi:hypothetical protein